MKRALLLNAVSPAIGGVLIRGHKGTAKSTAVRALAGILPDIEVVSGCRFSCDPLDTPHLCSECRARAEGGETLTGEQRAMRVVELPVNASEDRVVGSIDIEAAIGAGLRRFDPGVLAAANRGVLYVDEVNLLDDHVVDVLLDAAAMGTNSVEREGISFAHPARFILVGTMNPEEGELRPQLLERFGLCVDVFGLTAIDLRIQVMENAEHLADGAFDMSADDVLRRVIVKAGELVPLTTVSPLMRQLIALICIDAGAVGHRADIVVSRAAAAICAWREAERVVGHDPEASDHQRRPADALQVTSEDVIEAAQLGLAHRRRERRESGQETGAPSAESARQRMEELAAQTADQSEEAATTDDDEEAAGDPSSDAEGDATGDGGDGRVRPGERRVTDVATPSELFSVRKIQLPRDRRSRAASGKRAAAQSSDRRGRYVRAVQAEHITDVALDATLRAAAPHQQHRRASAPADSGVAVHLERHDLRQKVRRRKTGTLIVFVVDASASMDAEQRMQATKGAVLSLLRDAYLRRDKVSLVVFSGRSARVALAPTSSVDLAENRLQRLGVGGTTPLTHGLVAGLRLVRGERLRDPSVLPLMVLISDGRGNISLFGDEPLLEAQRVAEQIGNENIRVLVIDSARDHIAGGSSYPSMPSIPGGAPLFGGGYGFNACLDLAERSGGEYLGLYDLSQGAILAGVERSLRGR